MNDKIEVLKKISLVKSAIRNTNIKKAGWNTFSKYSFFTPEQIVHLAQDNCRANNLLTLFSTHRDENGTYATLTVVDLDSGQEYTFSQRTAIPEIKATNVAQQLGGMNTYSNRYLLMFAFDIVDNSLDFDNGKNESAANTVIKRRSVEKKKQETKSSQTAKEKPKMPASGIKFDKAVEFIKNGGKWEAAEKGYTFTSEIKEAITKAAGVEEEAK